MSSCSLFRSFRFPAISLVLASAAAFALSASAASVKWEPIPPEQLAAVPPLSDPDVVAEVLYHRVDLIVRDYKATQRNLQRIKIYSEQAVEELGKLAIESSEEERVSDLAARVTHRDGRVTELPASRFQESLLGRVNRSRLTSRRLIVPHLAAGDIVEFRWRVDADGRFRGSRFFYPQQRLPVRKFEFLVNNDQGMPMNLTGFGASDAKLDVLSRQRARMVMNNLPALAEEVDMPPAFNTRASVLLVYGELPAFDNLIWSLALHGVRATERELCAVTKEIQAGVRGIVSAEAFREDQLRQLYNFCQQQVVNIAYDESPASLQERVEYRLPRKAAEVWKQRRGNTLEVNCLFAALAKAAGFDARLTFSADRDQVMDVRFSHGWFFMKTSGVLVKVAGDWRLFAPGERAVPFGLARWQREDTEVIYSENDFLHWEKVRTSFLQQAKQLRQGKFTLSQTGELAGRVTEILEGQLAIAWREAHWNDAAPLVQEAVVDRVRLALPEAEVDEVTVENAIDIEKPVILHYRLRLPHYVRSAGEQRVIVPGIFHQHARPRYSTPTRTHPVWWAHAWQELDEFEISLPDGYEIESLSHPAAVYERQGLLRHTVGMNYHRDQRRLDYRREAVIGRADATIFAPSAYPAIRQLFEEMHVAQTHALILKEPQVGPASDHPVANVP